MHDRKPRTEGLRIAEEKTPQQRRIDQYADDLVAINYAVKQLLVALVLFLLQAMLFFLAGLVAGRNVALL